MPLASPRMVLHDEKSILTENQLIVKQLISDLGITSGLGHFVLGQVDLDVISRRVWDIMQVGSDTMSASGPDHSRRGQAHLFPRCLCTG